jgi:hypothetical protein
MCFPPWAVWLAQDECGDWWIYEYEPLQNDTGWYENEIGRIAKVTTGAKNTLWHSTLTKLQLSAQ